MVVLTATSMRNSTAVAMENIYLQTAHIHNANMGYASRKLEERGFYLDGLALMFSTSTETVYRAGKLKQNAASKDTYLVAIPIVPLEIESFRSYKQRVEYLTTQTSAEMARTPLGGLRAERHSTSSFGKVKTTNDGDKNQFAGPHATVAGTNAHTRVKSDGLQRDDMMDSLSSDPDIPIIQDGKPAFFISGRSQNTGDRDLTFCVSLIAAEGTSDYTTRRQPIVSREAPNRLFQFESRTRTENLGIPIDERDLRALREEFGASFPAAGYGFVKDREGSEEEKKILLDRIESMEKTLIKLENESAAADVEGAKGESMNVKAEGAAEAILEAPRAEEAAELKPDEGFKERTPFDFAEVVDSVGTNSSAARLYVPPAEGFSLPAQGVSAQDTAPAETVVAPVDATPSAVEVVKAGTTPVVAAEQLGLPVRQEHLRTLKEFYQTDNLSYRLAYLKNARFPVHYSLMKVNFEVANMEHFLEIMKPPEEDPSIYDTSGIPLIPINSLTDSTGSAVAEGDGTIKADDAPEDVGYSTDIAGDTGAQCTSTTTKNRLPSCVGLRFDGDPIPPKRPEPLDFESPYFKLEVLRRRGMPRVVSTIGHDENHENDKYDGDMVNAIAKRLQRLLESKTTAPNASFNIKLHMFLTGALDFTGIAFSELFAYLCYTFQDVFHRYILPQKEEAVFAGYHNNFDEDELEFLTKGKKRLGYRREMIRYLASQSSFQVATLEHKFRVCLRYDGDFPSTQSIIDLQNVLGHEQWKRRRFTADSESARSGDVSKESTESRNKIYTIDGRKYQIQFGKKNVRLMTPDSLTESARSSGTSTAEEVTIPIKITAPHGEVFGWQPPKGPPSSMSKLLPLTTQLEHLQRGNPFFEMEVRDDTIPIFEAEDRKVASESFHFSKLSIAKLFGAKKTAPGPVAAEHFNRGFLFRQPTCLTTAWIEEPRWRWGDGYNVETLQEYEERMHPIAAEKSSSMASRFGEANGSKLAEVFTESLNFLSLKSGLSPLTMVDLGIVAGLLMWTLLCWACCCWKCCIKKVVKRIKKSAGLASDDSLFSSSYDTWDDTLNDTLDSESCTENNGQSCEETHCFNTSCNPRDESFEHPKKTGYRWMGPRDTLRGANDRSAEPKVILNVANESDGPHPVKKSAKKRREKSKQHTRFIINDPSRRESRRTASKGEGECLFAVDDGADRNSEDRLHRKTYTSEEKVKPKNTALLKRTVTISENADSILTFSADTESVDDYLVDDAVSSDESRSTPQSARLCSFSNPFLEEANSITISSLTSATISSDSSASPALPGGKTHQDGDCDGGQLSDSPDHIGRSDSHAS